MHAVPTFIVMLCSPSQGLQCRSDMPRARDGAGQRPYPRRGMAYQSWWQQKASLRDRSLNEACSNTWVSPNHFMPTNQMPGPSINHEQ